MRAAILLALALPAAADGIAKAQAIAKAGPEAARAAIPELIALGKGAPLERFAARDALAVAGPPAISKLIGEALGNPSLRLLLEGVSHDLGAGVVAPALPLLASEDPKVRAMAALSLGAAGAGGEAAVKPLVTALHDKDAEVRREAALAIGRIGRGAHDAIPGLIHLANDAERGLTREALLALGMIVRDAAERDRPVPKPSPEVAAGIESGLAWLVRHQRPEGWWEVRRAYDDPRRSPAAMERACILSVASLALLAVLDSGAQDRYRPQLRSGLRYLIVADAPAGGEDTGVLWPRARIAATLCAAARVLDEPECRVAAERAIAAIGAGQGVDPDAGWRSLALLEADFAGVPFDGALRSLIDVREPEVRLHEKPEWRLSRERARWYAGGKSDAICPKQDADGSWDLLGGSWGRAHTTAAMLLTLETASGLAHPLTMPLPDAPQLKAAVATLRIARQNADEAIRAAAEQALAGFR